MNTNSLEIKNMFIIGAMDFDQKIHDILAFINSEKCENAVIDTKKSYGIFNKCCIKSIIELIKINDSKANIINMGIGMLYYIFFVILRYTKNLKLTIFLSERAILLYSEFIIQSSEKKKNGDLVFTPSLGDAITFAYKKTIGRLSIKHFEEENNFVLEFPLQEACLVMKSIFLYFYELQEENHDYLDELNELFFQSIYIGLENELITVADIEWLLTRNQSKENIKQCLKTYFIELFKNKKRKTIHIEEFYKNYFSN